MGILGSCVMDHETHPHGRQLDSYSRTLWKVLKSFNLGVIMSADPTVISNKQD